MNIEKLVGVYKYNINENTIFIAYMAEWCKPCTRIKPVVFENCNNFDCINTTIPLSEFKLINEFIPYFEIHNKELVKIQTSDKEIFNNWFKKNTIIIDFTDNDF